MARKMKTMDGNQAVHKNEAVMMEGFSEAEQCLLRRFLEQILDRKSTRLNSSHVSESRMPSSA